MKKFLVLGVLAVVVSTTLGGAALAVLAGPLEDYIGVVGGGSQLIDPTPFTVDIDVFTDEQTFCAYQHLLSFDPTKVQVDSVTLQESGHFPYFCSSSIDNVAGTVTSTCARLGCGPGAFSGTDQVQMHCIAGGGSALVLVPDSTMMRDNQNQPIVISRYDGSVTCQEPSTPTPTPTPTPPPGVGGTVELHGGASTPSAQQSNSAAPPFAVLALAAAAAAIAIAASARYARRRWSR